MLRTVRLAGATLAAAALLPAGSALGAVHTVMPGETLWGIAMANNLPTRTVAAANGLSPEARVIAGTRLTIPVGGTTATATATGAGSAGQTSSAPTSAGSSGTRVQWGDTLSGLAVRHGVSLSRLAAVNGLDPAGPLLAGTRLTLPAAGGAGASASSSAVSSSSSSAAPEAMGAYTVRWGDTLSGLAARSRIGLAQMAYMNGLNPDKPLLTGTVLKLPTGSPISTTTTAPVSSSAAPSAPPAASPGRLTADQIRSIAAEHGAPSSLATAIAWQESGFNNRMLSSANARGIMQVLPGTWDWVQSNLSRSRRLDPSSPTDNVRAGSLYLAQLLRDTDGDPAMAAAAYYQGLSSVRRIGMLPETRRYVANVLSLRSRFGG